MDKLEAMNAFVKVLTHGSYAEAGRMLGLTRSAVSKAVMELEQLLGARLLDRTTRRVAATEAGLAYYEQCVDILARVEETELQVTQLHDQPRGVLKVNGPMSFGGMYLGPAIADFMSRYREVKVHLSLNDRFVDPIEEGFDVTVRIAQLNDSSLIARKLAPVRRVLVASPSYLEECGEPDHPDELVSHRCLTYGHTTTLQKWQLSSGGQVTKFPITSVMCSNNGDVLRAAAVADSGIALLPTFIVGPYIASGQLRMVLEDFPPDSLTAYALYLPNKYLATKTRLLIDHLVDAFGDRPSWDSF